MATAQSTHSFFFFFFRKESHKTTDSPEEGQQQRTVPPEEALPAGLPQNTAHRAARPGTAQLPAAPRPPAPRGDPLSFPLTPGRGTGTERGGGGHPHLVKAKAMRLRMVKLRRVMVCGR